VKKLLSRGVSPDSSNADGLTALHQVSTLHSFDYCKSLLCMQWQRNSESLAMLNSFMEIECSPVVAQLQGIACLSSLFSMHFPCRCAPDLEHVSISSQARNISREQFKLGLIRLAPCASLLIGDTSENIHRLHTYIHTYIHRSCSAPFTIKKLDQRCISVSVQK